MRYKRKAFHRKMLFAFKKFQKHFSKLIYSVCFHLFPPKIVLLLTTEEQARKPVLLKLSFLNLVLLLFFTFSLF